jgi:ribosomal peptide maturation radical SAM protein 1
MSISTSEAGREEGADTGGSGLRVLLLSMPFAALERPSLGLGLLKPLLERCGVRCDVRYLAFDFAEFVGLEDYLWVYGGLPYTAFAGDWAFTRSLYGDRPELDAGYLEQILRQTWQLDEPDVARLGRVRAYCDHFLDHCLASVPWDEYDVVGFTSTFEQNIASLALAKRVKEARPETAVVFGGANWEGEMGLSLHERFPFVDVVCSGEADDSFPALVSALARGERLDGIPGIVYRDGDESISTGPAPLVRDLDALPFPDFDDYVAALLESPAAADLTPTLLLESSRGCWWGAKHHCTFCGLNGGTMAFRSKSPERVLAEIHHLRERFDIETISVVDNILDMAYFSTLLPMLEDEGLDLNLFYEVKANLTHEQVRQLAAAGVHHVQPGLESFSDHVLELMRKGTTALQNIQLLKWCRELGVKPEWNLLYGFPGEEPEDYQRMLPLFDAIEHLDPPGACGPVRLDRFSPYHSDPAGLGMTSVRALAPYRYLYPFDDDVLLRIAYYFDFDYADGREPLDYVRPVLERVRRWSSDGPRAGLWVCPGEDGSVTLVRERAEAARETLVLDGWQAAAYLACDRATSPARLRRLSELEGVGLTELESFLSWCVERRLMAGDGVRYLGLAVHSPPRLAAAEPAVVEPETLALA